MHRDEIGVPAIPADSPCLLRLLSDLKTVGLAHADRRGAAERLADALGEELSRKLVRALVEEGRPQARVAPPHAA